MKSGEIKTVKNYSWLGILFLIGLPLLTIFAYSGSFENPFHYDDIHSVLNNPHIRKLENIPKFFSDPRLFDAYPENAMYRPLLLVTYALNYHFGGYGPVGFHLVNLALHLGCVFALFGIAWRLYPLSKLRGGRLFRWLFAGTTSLVYALHPVQTEPMNYISSRSSVLAAFFFLLSFLFFLLHRAGQKKGIRILFYSLSLVGFSCGLLSKSIVATLPLTLLLFEFLFPLQRKRRWTSIVPFFLFTGAYLVLRKVLLGSAVISISQRLARGTDLLAGGQRDIFSNILTQAKVFLRYLRLLFYPDGLCVDPGVSVETGFTLPVIFSIGVILLLLTCAWFLRRRLPLITFGFLWFGITLLPTSSIIPLNVIMNEHRLYLPSSGFFFLFGLFPLAVFFLFEKKKDSRVWVTGKRFVPIVLSLLLPVALAGIYFPFTRARCAVWKNEFTLWKDTVKKAPSSYRGYMGLGNAYAMVKEYEKAIEEYQKSLAIYPEFTEARINLGEAYNHLGVQKGRPEDFLRAESEYLRVLQKKPCHTLLNLKLAALYRNMGRTLKWTEKFDSARVIYLSIFEQDPENYYAQRALAELSLEEGKTGEGISAFERLIKQYPSDRHLKYKLVEILIEAGSLQPALACCQDILNRDPFNPKAHSLMERIYGREGLNIAGKAAFHRKIARALGGPLAN